MSGKGATCETCVKWAPNTVGRILGHCRLNGSGIILAFSDPVRFLRQCVPYNHRCGQHEKEPTHD